MGSFLQDVRYALRMLVRTPGMTAAATLTLALGIGANTAVFSGVQNVLLNPIPGVVRADELVEFYVKDAALAILGLSPPDYRDYRERNDVFAGLLAFGWFPMSLTEGDATERVWLLLASGNYFDVLGVRVADGRAFLPDEDTAGGQPVLIISHGLWQRRFGGRPDTVGKKISLNGHNFTIVGITPPGFYGTITGLAFDGWAPLALQDRLTSTRRSEDRGARWLNVVGRLKPGVSLAQAEARLNLVADDLARTYPATNTNLRAEIFPPGQSPRGAPALLGPMFGVLTGLVGLLLLIACANVANLLLSRATSRRREIAIRIALGANRARLVRQLLTESLLLALLGGIVGLPAGIWTSYSLGELVPPADIPFNLRREIDPQVFLYALALSGATALIFGLVPALQATRAELVTALKDDVAGATGGHGKSRLRGNLVVAQVALSLVLLVAAGLFLRSLLNAQAVETGFNTRNVLLGALDLLPRGYDAARGAFFYQQLSERLETIPGVRVVSFARRVPLGFSDMPSADIVVEGYAPRADERVWSKLNWVAPGFFRALEVPLVRGREFTYQDDDQAARVAVINETLAARYWPGRDPIGQRLRFQDKWLTIIGVARDFKAYQLNEPPAPFLFLPATQFYRTYMTLMVRTAGDPAGVAPAVLRTVREMDEQLPLIAVRTLERHIGAASFPQRAAASLMSAFGLVALALAAVGIYGVMAYGVAQRVREIGIRMAIGAQPRDILRLILGSGFALTLLGIGLGLAGALGVTRLLKRFLLGVGPDDVTTFAAVTLLLAGVALVACYIPARRAMRIDPAVALRHE